MRPPHTCAVVVLSLGALLAAAPAHGASSNAIPGAVYRGTHVGGGTLRFTVAGDGQRVTSYRINQIPGNTCMFIAQGDENVWPGAGIVNNAFSYNLYAAIVFKGTFPSIQSASGTLRLMNPAVGSKPACSSGTIAWTAKTTSAPLPPGSPTYQTTVSLRKRGKKKLTGAVKSQGTGCKGKRKVILKRGKKTLKRATTTSSGKFTFKRTKAMRGRRVRAAVLPLRRPALICAAGASKSVRVPKH